MTQTLTANIMTD